MRAILKVNGIHNCFYYFHSHLSDMIPGIEYPKAFMNCFSGWKKRCPPRCWQLKSLDLPWITIKSLNRRVKVKMGMNLSEMAICQEKKIPQRERYSEEEEESGTRGGYVIHGWKLGGRLVYNWWMLVIYVLCIYSCFLGFKFKQDVVNDLIQGGRAAADVWRSKHGKCGVSQSQSSKLNLAKFIFFPRDLGVGI